MYNLPHFKASGSGEVLRYMQAHPFALICGVDENGKPVATQLPFLFEEREDKLFLQAHVMRSQDHTNAFLVNPDVLVVFTGAHAYVSASWYEEKKVASTWNYQAVHAAGKIEFKDSIFLHQLLTRLTEKYELPDSPSLLQEMDIAYVEKNMKAIVAFEIEVVSVRHVFKLSQNRDKKSFDSIVSKLSEAGGESSEVAEAMAGKIKTDS